MFDKAKFYVLLSIFLNWGVVHGCTLSTDPSGYEYPKQVCDLVKAFKTETIRNNRILLQGSYGTGKSTLARSIAKETDSEVIEIRCSELVGPVYGDASNKIEQYIGKAKRLHKATGKKVVFHLDEVDAIAHKITAENQIYHEQRTSGLQTLWQYLDKYSALDTSSSAEDEELRKSFLFICTTNRYKDLDPVFLSRFQRVLALKNPDLANRKRMAKFYAQENKISERLEEGDINKIAKKTNNMSLRSIEQIIGAIAERSEACNCFNKNFIDEEIKTVEHFEKTRIESEKETLNKNKSATSSIIIKCTALSVILTQAINHSPKIYAKLMEKLPQLCNAIQYYAPTLTNWTITAGKSVVTFAWYICKFKTGA